MKQLLAVSTGVLFVIAFLSARPLYAQEEHSIGVAKESKTAEAPNAVFLELLGNGILYSINYDRFLAPDYGVRVGFMYLGVSSPATPDGSSASASVMMIPLTFNYFFASHDNGKVGSSKLELGAGIVYGHASASASGNIGSVLSGSASSVLGTATIGYRYQPSDGGLLFRAGLTPLFYSGGLLLWFGLSVGMAF